MSGFNMVFKRYEKKYMLTKEQYEKFRETADNYMKVDEYGLSTICNIYYDTDAYDLIRNSIEKPVYKEKIRLRSYGVPTDKSTVFLELKKKYKGIVYKRREAMTLTEAYQCVENLDMGERKDQISQEIDYFLKMYRPVPKVFLAYDRIAMFGIEDHDFRITFDFNIRSRNTEIDLREGDQGELLFEDGRVLMELMVSGAYPFWLIELLEDCEIYPVSFSKYGTVYKRILLQKNVAVYPSDVYSSEKLNLCNNIIIN